MPSTVVVVPLTGERASRRSSAPIRAQACPPWVAAAQAADRWHACANACRAVSTVVAYHGSSPST